MPLPRFVVASLSVLLLLAFSPALTAQERTPLQLAVASPVISEFLANPAAVADSAGEWIEIHNPGPDPVNLLGWTLADLDSDHHTMAAEVTIAPGGYVVLARNGDPAANGGVNSAYVYGGAVQLANTTDELLLLDPDGAEVDRVLWGDGTDLSVPNGASLERTDLGAATSKAIRAVGGMWAAATTPWSGSAGDFGSPGQPFAGSNPATFTPTAPPTDSPTPDPSLTATPSSTPTPSPTPTLPGNPTETSTLTATSSPTSTPTPTPASSPPELVISEFLANPAAVADSDGEWIEIHNPGPHPVNLQGWILADEGTDRHVITADLPVPVGRYVILARNGDAATNGGVTADYAIVGGLQLANTADELLILAPDATQVDRVAWGDGTGLTVTNGASLERTDFNDPAVWTTAHTAWPGSAGDRGSPGQPYVAPPDASPTPTPTRTPPARWQPVNAPSPLIFDEIYFRSADNEFIVLHNRGDSALDLSGWVVGDAEFPGDGEGMHALPDGVILAPDARFVIARNGATFRTRWGRSPDAQIQATEPDVPALARRTDLASGSLALNDSGDEVLLLSPAGLLADAVAYANGDYAALGLSGDLRPASDAGLHRVDGPDFPAQPDGRHRYLFAPPAPFVPLPPLPASSHASPMLDTTLRAVWGTLAARSNFSPNGTAPPGYLLAAAHAQGLDFVALADPILEETGRTGSTDLTFLPRQEASVVVDAWAWGDLLGASAVVYAAPTQASLNQSDLLAHVRDRGVLQWLSANPPTDPVVVAIPGDDVAASGGWTTLARQWAESGAAWLPAGNSNPTLPGEVDPAPHFSGLAVTQADQTGILQALAARRGWLTNRPGLWLTLRTDQAWMGTVLPPVEQLSGPLTFHIHYGDLSGQPAGMTLWRNDRPLVTLDIPSADGRWSPTVPLAAGVYYVVATQPDGDFAITAPLIIPSTPPTPIPTPTITPTPGPTRLPANHGQAPGPPGSLAAAKLAGLDATVRFRAQIIAPPGLYNASIYVAEPASGSTVGGLGVQIYLRRGDFPALAEGDWVDIQGRLDSFRGELELILDSPDQIWRIGPGDTLVPLPVQPEEVNESLESRLVTLAGVITGWGWDSLYLAANPNADPETESVRVTVRSSLSWRRPYVNLGEVWQVTGIVSQFATAAPWNDGYRILVRYESDLVRVKK